MEWSDNIALLNLRIARQERYRDWIEGINSNVFGPRGEAADWSNPAHTDGCDPNDTTGASNHRWTGTGGGDAYFAWWRSQYPTVDENETDPVTLGVYEAWKDWSDNGSNVRAQTGMEAALTAHKQNIADLTAKRDLLQSKIDSGASDGPPE
tara:strand:- start:5001 stop:5453 length:453 start_codon:yes stop_codon:yes gene_type:complete